MSRRILIEPADLRRAARTYSDAAGSLRDVRQALFASPPDMPESLSSRVTQVREHSIRDLTEQLDYLPREALALRRRARFAELADDGRFNPFLDLFDPFGPGGVPALDARFAMPTAPRKGFWEQGIPGFFAGAGGNLANTAVSLWDLAKAHRDPDERRELGEGMAHAVLNPGAALRALWADISAEEDREAGRHSRAAGAITVEVVGVAILPLLKLTKLPAVAKVAKTAEQSSDAASKSSGAAGDAAAAARRRLERPRWQRGEVPSRPTGPGPGRWARREDVQRVVVDPAEQAAAAAGRRADDAQQALAEAEANFRRWQEGLAAAENAGHADTAAKVEKASDTLAEQRRAGGGR